VDLAEEAAEAQLVAQMGPHLEDKVVLVLEEEAEEMVALEHNLDLVEAHLEEVMELLRHLVAQAVAAVVAALYQEILEQVEE
jgi:hypothetical protein